jgi:ribosome-binding protein aMBF1 (putative translation factor)/mRNA-degrading endonuclease RelE of RelBE toxin-antitoxin system
MKVVVYARTAATALRAHANRAKLIRSKIWQYATDASSQANNVKAVVGVDAKRLRLGAYRVIFTETEDTITVLDIGPRGGIYEWERTMAVMTKTPTGEDIVILSRKEYDRLLLAANEDASDARTAKRAIARDEEVLNDIELDELLSAKSALAFWRKKRGLTQAQLANQAAIAQGFLSEIEGGRKKGDVAVLQRIAAALGISLLDLVPDLPTGNRKPGAKITAPKRRR